MLPRSCGLRCKLQRRLDFPDESFSARLRSQGQTITTDSSALTVRSHGIVRWNLETRGRCDRRGLGVFLGWNRRPRAITSR